MEMNYICRVKYTNFQISKSTLMILELYAKNND